MRRIHLIEILLPMFDNAGRRFPLAPYDAVRGELVDKFGGLTAHLRAPATGMWKPDEASPAERDVIVIYEIMAPKLDPTWWQAFKARLENLFRQHEVVIRTRKVRVM